MKLELNNKRPSRCLAWLVRLFLRWTCRKLVVQGYHHRGNIIAYFQIMREAANGEFYEDNKPTLDAFLQECFDEANDQGEAQPPAKNL